MSSIDERVVRMMFDNRQFEQSVSTSLGTLDKLNKSLKLEGAAKGLEDVDAAAKRVSLSSIASGVDSIASKFKALSVVGVTTLATLTTRVASAGINMVKSLSLSPVMDGYHEYETNLNAIQTIMANTGLTGQSGLNKVNVALNELNTYSDKTIYNFSEMARNIGTFTAAGVDLKTSTAAIKGIANLAAVSGSNADQASTAMYQLSQAIAAGKVNLQDWNSVVNAGMGGKVFQSALIDTARVHGVAIDKMIKKEGGFRNTLQKGWLTSGILTETLSKFTGDLNAKQLKAMGYTDKQAQKIMQMAKTAQDAATKVKTMSQLIDTLKEALGSGWTKTWQLVFGDFNEAKTLFTSVSNTLGGFINTSANARNKVLSDWKAMGGRTVLIDAISLAFHALIAVIKPIKDAFREIFPKETGKSLFELTKTIHVFAENLLISKDTADKVKRVFAGFFAVLGIGWDIVKQVGKTLVTLFKTASGGSGSFLDIAARVGDFLVGIHKAIEEGKGLTDFFKDLGKVLAYPILLLQKGGSYLDSLFGGFDGTKAAKQVAGVATNLNPLQRTIDLIRSGGDKVAAILGKIAQIFSPIAKAVVNFFGDIGKYIQSGFTNIDFSNVLNVINTGLLGGLILIIKKFVDKLRNGHESGLGGIVDTIKESFEQLTNTLSAMQQTLKATTLLEIAAAIGILTISVIALSKIDANGLERALTAMAVMFTQLFTSMAVFNKVVGSSGFAKMSLVTGAMILLAISLDLLTIAVTNLSKLNWNDLAKGLTGVTVLIGSLFGAMKLMPPASGMISTGLGMIALAAAINILVTAVTNLSGFSWKDLSKGLAGVAGLLVSLALFTKFADADKGGVLQGAGIILLATGIQILAKSLRTFSTFSWKDIGKSLTVLAGALTLIGAALYLIPPSSVLSAAAILIVASSLGMIGDAIKSMAKMNWKDIGKGLTVLAGALTLIAAALYVLPPTSVLSAAAILIVAASLSLIGDALESMSQMSWGEIAKGLVALAGSLGIIAVAMLLMVDALPGAAALLVVTGSLLILLPVLTAFSQMSWEEMGKSLLMLAGVFAVLGAAGILLGPLVPVLMGLGASVLLLGAGMLAAGAGVLLFSTGLTALSVSGAAAATALVLIVTDMLGLIPLAMKQVGLGIVAFASVISTSGPAITKALVVVLSSLIDAISTLTPKITGALLNLLVKLLGQLAKYEPQMISAGFRLLLGILNGIANNIGKVVTAATNVIVNFINGINRNLPRIIHAGAELIISFINGVADEIRRDSGQLESAGRNLSGAIIQGMVAGLAGGVKGIADQAASMAKSAINSAKSVLDINSPSKEFIKIGQSVNEGFYKGLTSGNKSQVDSAFNSLRNQLATAINDSSKSIDSLEKKLKKLTSARHRDNSEIRDTKKALAEMKKEHAAETSAYSTLTKSLSDEHWKLGQLANQYASLSTRIKTAQQSLADAIKTRDDFNKSVKDQYDTLPDISDTSTVSGFEDDLKKQIEDTKQLSNALQRLRKLGLNDTLYKDLLAKGTSALPFVQELLRGGKTSVDQVNSLGKQLDAVSAQIGNTASSALYQAAVNSAQGLVDGLKKQQAAIEKQMDAIADAMVKAIKKKLGIRSPSKVFAEIGGYSAQGLAKGFEASSDVVAESAASMGKTAMESMRKSLTNITDMVNGGIDAKPTITPVLDLSTVKRDAGQIGDLLSRNHISVDAAYAKAVSASTEYMTNRSDQSQTSGQNGSNSAVTYNQYNNSPKALSSAEIYRQTKNQLSKTKEALESDHTV